MNSLIGKPLLESLIKIQGIDRIDLLLDGLSALGVVDDVVG